eukprot:RCo029677
MQQSSSLSRGAGPQSQSLSAARIAGMRALSPASTASGFTLGGATTQSPSSGGAEFATPLTQPCANLPDSDLWSVTTLTPCQSVRSTSTASDRKRKATLYSYDTSITDRMEPTGTESVMVVMEPNPFGSGGCCEAFRVRLGQPNEELGSTEVAKRYRHKYGFLEEWRSLRMGASLAEKFNAELCRNPPPPAITGGLECKVSFLAWDRILDYAGDLYTVESFLEGNFCKYNNIFGGEEMIPHGPAEQLCCYLAGAYSHFTFVQSGHRYMILDVQGVGATFTDVAVVSLKASQYGYTDTGPKAIAAFFDKHKCNPLCRHLGLKPITGSELPEPIGTATPVSLPREPSSHQFEWIDDQNRAHLYDPDTQGAIRAAMESGQNKVRIYVGEQLHSVIDMKMMQQLSLKTGDTTYVHRQPTVPKLQRQPTVLCESDEYHVQLMLDDQKWHTFDNRIQDSVRAAMREGKMKTQVMMGGVAYDLDFATKMQRNTVTGKTRPIRFVLITQSQKALPPIHIGASSAILPSPSPSPSPCTSPAPITPLVDAGKDGGFSATTGQNGPTLNGGGSGLNLTNGKGGGNGEAASNGKPSKLSDEDTHVGRNTPLTKDAPPSPPLLPPAFPVLPPPSSKAERALPASHRVPHGRIRNTERA